MTNTTLHKTILLPAAPDVVWDYLTQPELMAKWFHAPAAPLEQGGKLEIHGKDSGDLMIWGAVTVARKPDYLEYTFAVGPMGDATSTVKWTLDALDGGTKLTLTHEGLPEGAAAFGLLMALDDGWDKHLDGLRGALKS